MKNKKKRKSESLVRVAIHYQDKPIVVKEVFLFVCSLFASLCNVLAPLLEKYILENLTGSSTRNYAALFVLITAASYLFLGVTNVLNLQVFYRFRLIRENERILSLSEKDPDIIHKEGAGAYSAAVFGDSDQISKVVAANWFLIIFNVRSAIASRVISAVYSLYFLVIALIGYILIILAILVFTKFSIQYYRKGKEDGYSLSPKVRELVDDRNAILSYTTRKAYQGRIQKFFLKRDGNQRKSEEIDAIEDVFIKGVEALCAAVFLFFGIRQRNPSSSLYNPAFDYPTLVALISYFTTIFVPIPSLSSTFKNRRRFHAFYERIKEVVSCEPVGKIPANRELSFDKVTIDEHPEDREATPLMLNFSLQRKGRIGLYRKDQVLQQKFMQIREEDILPSGGKITLGGYELKDIRKSLVRGLIRFPSTLNDIFFDGFEFNITLGKPLLTDEEYLLKEKEYEKGRKEFLLRLKDKTIFQRKHRKIFSRYLKDILGMDMDALKSEEEKKILVDAFSAIQDIDLYVSRMGPCFFSREYAHLSRYESLLVKLDRKDLKTKNLGPKGKNLTIDEKKKILLARFFLPDNPALRILNDNRIPSDKSRFRNVFSSFVPNPSILMLSSDYALLRERSDTIVKIPAKEEKKADKW